MFNTAFYHVVVLFLGQMFKELKNQTISDIQSGKVGLKHETLYVKKEITAGAGIINLIDSNTLNSPGICNFDKNTLQTGRLFVFDQISIGYQYDAAVGKEGQIIYNRVAPAGLQNAILRITQNGKTIVNLPVIDLHNLAAGNSRADQYTQLKSLELLVDDKTIEVQLVFPTGATMPADANKHYIHVSLSGLQTVSK